MDFVRVSVAVVPRAYEPCLDRLLPLLFLRLADGKETMRAACAEALKGGRLRLLLPSCC